MSFLLCYFHQGLGKNPKDVMEFFLSTPLQKVDTISEVVVLRVVLLIVIHSPCYSQNFEINVNLRNL